MELAELYRISEKYAMEDVSTRPKVILERKGISYTRCVRKKGDKRPQRTRSKSVPHIDYRDAKSFVPYNIEPPKQLSDAEGDSDDFDSVRIRQFSTTMKGLVNKGDLRKDSRRDSGYSTTSTNCRRSSTVSISSVSGRRNSSCGQRETSSIIENNIRRKSTFASAYCTPVRRTSCISDREYKKLGSKLGFGFDGSQDSILDECPSEYQVLVFGSSGVGKSAIISQFTTSEFLGASDVHTGIALIFPYVPCSSFLPFCALHTTTTTTFQCATYSLFMVYNSFEQL